MKRGGPLKRRTHLRARKPWKRRGTTIRRSSFRVRSERQETIERLHSVIKGKVCQLSAGFSPKYGAKRYMPAPCYPAGNVVDLGDLHAGGPLVLPTCARCGRRLPRPYLDLDEVDGRHTGGLVPGAIWPPNQQLLCRGCHNTKPTEEGGHVNYCERHQPQVHQRLVAFGAEIKRNLPDYPGQMKPDLQALGAAIRAACAIVYK